MARDVLDCIHGVDLLRACPQCRALVDAMVKEYDMQTSGTFPQLNRTDSVTRRPAPKKAGKKR